MNAPATEPRLSLEKIQKAMHVVSPEFLNSPQFMSEPLSDRLGARVVLKVETVNPIASFKGRGAENYVAGLQQGARLVCGSAGNFGQALAYSGRRHGIPVTVYAAETASPVKVQRMRMFGADVRLYGQDFDAAKERAQMFAAESGACFVEDGKEPAISEGAGTIAVELCRWPDPLDFVVAPLGNGALLAGIGCWMKAWSPQTRIIGVCAAGAPAMADSWRGSKSHAHVLSTIADGIAVRVPIPEAVSDLRNVLDDVVLVDDDTLIAAMRLVFAEHRLVVEPAGVAGLGALIAYPERFRRATVATPLCGGNMTIEQMKKWLI